MSGKISLEGLDKAKVLAALYNAARGGGLGLLQYNSKPMTEEEAAQMLKRQKYFDYVNGRVLKVDFAEDELDPYLYDRDNGQGSAERVINTLRSTGMVNPEESELQSLEGTRKAALHVRKNLGEETRFEGKALVLGFSDKADELKPKLAEILGEEESQENPTSNKTITLPDGNEIMKRLIGVYDDSYMAERFYPMIAEEGGRELTAEGIVIMFTLKIYDFVASGYPPVMAGILHAWVPKWIDALVDDKEVAEAAKTFHKDTTDSTSS